MDWLLNHLQVLFLIAVAVMAVLQRVKKATERGGSRQPVPAAPGEEERTRRIQEDIRRRIMERRGLAPAGEGGEESRPFPAPPPMIEEIRPVRVEPPPEAAPADERIAAELKRQQEMLARMRELEASRRARTRAASAAITVIAAPADRPALDLRSRGALQRAIVLREILGPPVGLR